MPIKIYGEDFHLLEKKKNADERRTSSWELYFMKSEYRNIASICHTHKITLSLSLSLARFLSFSLNCQILYLFKSQWDHLALSSSFSKC